MFRVFRCLELMVEVFWGVWGLGCLGCQVSMTFGKDQKGDQGGTQKQPKFRVG